MGRMTNRKQLIIIAMLLAASGAGALKTEQRSAEGLQAGGVPAPTRMLQVEQQTAANVQSKVKVKVERMQSAEKETAKSQAAGPKEEQNVQVTVLSEARQRLVDQQKQKSGVKQKEKATASKNSFFPMLTMMFDDQGGDAANLEVQGQEEQDQLKAESEGDRNIGDVPQGGSAARFIGYIIIALVVTFGLLSMGMCALWCRRQYKRYFIEERRQRENFDELVAGQVHHGMYKNEEGDWEMADPGEPAGSYPQDHNPHLDQQRNSRQYSGASREQPYSGGPGRGAAWSPGADNSNTQRQMAMDQQKGPQEFAQPRQQQREGRPSGASEGFGGLQQSSPEGRRTLSKEQESLQQQTRSANAFQQLSQNQTAARDPNSNATGQREPQPEQYEQSYDIQSQIVSFGRGRYPQTNPADEQPAGSDSPNKQESMVDSAGLTGSQKRRKFQVAFRNKNMKSPLRSERQALLSQRSSERQALPQKKATEADQPAAQNEE